MAENLDFELNVKKDELGKALDANTKKAVSLEGVLETALGVIGGGIALKALDLAVDGFKALISITKEGIKEAQQEEAAINSLNSALQRNGIFTEATSKSLVNFASGLQSASLFADDVIISNLSLLASLTNLSGNGLIQAQQAAADLATVLKIDLDTATRLVIKSANGNADAFKKYGIEVKKGATDTETFANALKVLSTEFGGAAANSLNTFTGKTKLLSNAYDQMTQSFGDAVIKNGTVLTGIGETAEIMENLGRIVSKIAPGIIDFFAKSAQFLLITPSKFWTDIFSGGAEQGLASTNESLESVTAKIKELTEFTNTVKGGASLDGTFTTKAEALEKLGQLIDQEQVLLKKRESFLKEGGTDFVGPSQDKSALGAVDERNAELVAKEKQLGLDLAAIRAQFDAEEAAFEDQKNLLKIEDDTIRAEFEITALADQKLRENELVYQAELEKNKLLGDARLIRAADEKAAAAKNLNDIKINNKKEIDLDNKKREDKKKSDIELAQDRRDTYATIATLASSNNKTLAVIGKAAAITQIGIDGPAAVVKALGAFPPPFNFVAAGLVGAAVAAQAAKVAGVQFQEGGFVGGANGASIGKDNSTASIREGELVLTGQDQQSLLSMIKGGSGGGDIIIQIDGREIVKAVRRQKQLGFAV